MPNLTPLAVRYLLWLIGLRILYIAAVNFLGIPNTLATTVILAAAPAVDIGMQAVRRATVSLDLRGWAKVWGVMISIYLIVNAIIPAMLVPAFRNVFADAAGVQLIAVTSGATALMLMLFLWIGARMGPRA